jgi:hypothetical protein
MKKLLLLLLILPYLAISQSADATPIENILLTNVAKNNNATRVIVQDSITKELKFVLKSTLNTNISIGNKNANTFQLLSSTGSGPVVPQATTTEAGLLNSSDKVKLNSVATGATANSTDAQLRDRTTHTGTQTASTISDIQSTITNNTAVLANTAKITNATHTGDATGSTALTLATVNANIGTFNNVNVNGKGLVTSGSNVTYATGSGSATGTNTGDQDLSGKANIASPTFTGTVSGITKAMVGLSNVDNTSDLNKPISTATQTALNLKANLAGGNNFTGNQNTLSGIVKVGNRPVATRAISFSASLNNFVIDNTVNGHSFEESSRLIAATNDASFGFYDNVPTITSLGSINPGHFNGFQSRMRYEGSADFLSGGFNGMNSFYSDIFIAGSGNVSATSGLYIQNSTVTGTGRVLNQYGVIIGNLNAGTVSNRGIACYTYRNFLQGLTIGSDVLDTENPLRVEGNGKFTGILKAGGSISSGTGQNNANNFTVDNNQNNISRLYSNGKDVSTNGDFEFYTTRSNGTNQVTALSIKGNGKVGFNQPNPTEVIDVVGNGKFSGTVTASPATVSTQLATLGQVRPYKIYVALLTQTGSSAPVATILENTLGGTVVWSRSVAGLYLGTLNNTFVIDKVLCLSTVSPSEPALIVSSSRSTVDRVQVRVTNAGEFTDNITNLNIEIRVYN